jgi:hypothetical protein
MKKKIILITVMLCYSLAYAQGGAAYKGYKSIGNEMSGVLQNFARLNAQRNSQNKEADRLANERAKIVNEKRFIKFRDLAIENFNNKKFSKCIEYYNSSLKLGYYDASLELRVGNSYYHFFVQTKKKKFKSRAKKLFKLAKKHGNIEAELLLDKYF